jgi:ribulose-phosphate 3-epimerase
MPPTTIEIVPAILRQTWENIVADWAQIHSIAQHVQLDITDGVFAGEGSFRNIKALKRLPQSDKIELHMMVHTPGHYLTDVIDLNPARCVFHIESFSGSEDVRNFYTKLREQTSSEVALALNPETPMNWVEEYIDLLDHVLFMGYNPGWANQPINPLVFKRVAEFRAKHPDMPIAVDGHVSKDTVADYVQAGATMCCANTAIFGSGNPIENFHQLHLLAQAAV